MFKAAFLSAFMPNPHETQRNFAWDFRFSRQQWPHDEQVWDV